MPTLRGGRCPCYRGSFPARNGRSFRQMPILARCPCYRGAHLWRFYCIYIYIYVRAYTCVYMFVLPIRCCCHTLLFHNKLELTQATNTYIKETLMTTISIPKYSILWITRGGRTLFNGINTITLLLRQLFVNVLIHVSFVFAGIIHLFIVYFTRTFSTSLNSHSEILLKESGIHVTSCSDDL